ncbi:MAG: thioesterase family protein [Anaerolineae bacterium]|jgi:acyl-CoA thioester hydrolase|nr:thioesterase family protein [Anaerolineae bacterium]MDX9829740.1 thioesterase family protein [Anaerolineae bacterium]
MPRTYVRSFQVRHYECDAYGHLNHAGYLRYMQESAFDASADAGWDMARYEAMGFYWLVRDTEIEYRRPLCYQDRVQVKTWVADFRRVRSQRVYEFRLEGQDEVMARAETDWAFMQRNGDRPAAIPDEMKADFFPEGLPEVGPPRPRFPGPPQPPGSAFRLGRRVEWRDLDPAGHVNNCVYLAYVEDGGLQWLRSRGWGMARLVAEGLGIVARQHRIEYRQPALLDDELDLYTWASDPGTTSIVRYTFIARRSDGALLARARTHQVWIDLQSGAPRPMPEALRQAMA